MQKASNVTNKTPWKGANNNLDFGDNGVDAAGHLILMSISRNGVHMIQTVRLCQD